MRTTLFKSFWPLVRPATFQRTALHAVSKPSPLGTAAGQVMALQTAVQVEKSDTKGAKPGLKVSQTEAPGVSDKQVLVKMKLRPVNPAGLPIHGVLKSLATYFVLKLQATVPAYMHVHEAS